MTDNAIGKQIDNSDDGLIARANSKMIFHGTGTEISNLRAVTPTSLYAFAGNGNDSVGSNNLTANGTPTYGSDGGVYGQYVILNGSSQYFTAASNTVFDVTTGDFSIWGYLYRTGDSGAEEDVIRKMGSGSTAGYAIVVTSADQLQAIIRDGTNGASTTASGMSVSTNTWYFWAASFARSGNTVLYLYNLSTGAYSTQSASISAVGSITNTQTFTVGRSSTGGSSFFPGRIDHLNVLMGTAITAQNVQDIISKLHGGMIAKCHGTSAGFTKGNLYERDEENTTWRLVYEDLIASTYGDGTDGVLNVTSGTTTLAANKQYSSLHVESGTTLDTAGFTVQSRFTRNSGTITDSSSSNRGAVGTAGTGTADAVGGTGGNGGAGANGGGYGGGGGGAGGGTSATAGGNGGAGGRGGGVVTLKTLRYTGSGTISAAGSAGSNGTNGTVGCGGGGAGGGGQGGTINLTVREVYNSITTSVTGGGSGTAGTGGGSPPNSGSFRTGGTGGNSNSATGGGGGAGGTGSATAGSSGGTAASSGGAGGGGGGSNNGNVGTGASGGSGGSGAAGTANIVYV